MKIQRIAAVLAAMCMLGFVGCTTEEKTGTREGSSSVRVRDNGTDSSETDSVDAENSVTEEMAEVAELSSIEAVTDYVSPASQIVYVSPGQLYAYFQDDSRGKDEQNIEKYLLDLNNYDVIVSYNMSEYYKGNNEEILAGLRTIYLENGNFRQYTSRGSENGYTIHEGTYTVNTEGMLIPSYMTCTYVQDGINTSYSIFDSYAEDDPGARSIQNLQTANEKMEFLSILAVTSGIDRGVCVNTPWIYDSNKGEYRLAGGTSGINVQLYEKDNMLVVPQVGYTLHTGGDGSFELRFDSTGIVSGGYQNVMYFAKDGTWTDDFYSVQNGYWSLLNDHLLVVAAPFRQSTGEFKDIYYFYYFYIDLDTEEVCVPAYIRSDAAARLLQ